MKAVLNYAYILRCALTSSSRFTVAHKKQERSPNFNQMIARVITCENDHVIVIGRS